MSDDWCVTESADQSFGADISIDAAHSGVKIARHD
jgi:hypothetical protein